MDKIDVKTALNQLDTSMTPVGIRYIKKNGERGEIYNVLKEAPYVKNAPAKGDMAMDERGKTLYHLQRNGVVLLRNADTNEFRSIKKAQMVGFRPAGSIKWLQIWH